MGWWKDKNLTQRSRALAQRSLTEQGLKTPHFAVHQLLAAYAEKAKSRCNECYPIKLNNKNRLLAKTPGAS